MAISRAVVLETLTRKGFSCSNLSDYKTLDSELCITCSQGHKFASNFRNIRDDRFKCLACEGKNSLGALMFGKEPPAKNGKRIVAIDNATQNAGVAVFDNGKLVHQELRTFEGETVDRMIQNRHFIMDVVAKQWHADLVIIEDIQMQNNVKLFKVLAMLSGNTQTALKEAEIPYELVLSTVWRSHYMINGKRVADKAQAIDKVANMYGIIVADDVAEAILLGKYAVDTISDKKPIKLF
jgi:Holliday junction resolvasome RuvABC endonuclease subunit